MSSMLSQLTKLHQDAENDEKDKGRTGLNNLIDDFKKTVRDGLAKLKTNMDNKSVRPSSDGQYFLCYLPKNSVSNITYEQILNALTSLLIDPEFCELKDHMIVKKNTHSTMTGTIIDYVLYFSVHSCTLSIVQGETLY